MNKSNLYILPLLTAFLFSCGGPVKVEGDVFLVKGDGKPQPAAAKQIYFIPAESQSLEDILIDSYISSVTEESQRNKETMQRLCSISSSIVKPDLDENKSNLSKIISDAKQKGISDSDGSCSLIEQNLISATANAKSSQEKYTNLLNEQISIITKAENEKIRLETVLRKKIQNREEELYTNFIKDIDITIDTTGAITLTNNTENNIKLTNDICLQFKNELGENVGTYSDSILGDCNDSVGSYKGLGTRIKMSNVNIRAKDSFGFERGGFLPIGQSTVKIKAVTGPGSSRWSQYGGNQFCVKSLTPAEKNKFTKLYGEKQKDWPNIFSPDQSKGYEELIPSVSANSYSGDSGACLIKGDPGKFVPLKDEVMTEKLDGSRIYSSEEIDFGKQARSFSYPETNLIEEQQKIINASKKERDRLMSLSKSDELIALKDAATKSSEMCKLHQQEIKSLQSKIDNLNNILQESQNCDVEDIALLDSLILTKEEEEIREDLRNIDYSIKATIKFMKIFQDSLYKTSTNISGHYVMSDLPQGEYIVVSNYADNFLDGIYLTRQAFDSDSTFDLSNSDFFEIPSIQYIAESFYEKCTYDSCSVDSMKNTLNLRFIEDDAGRIKDEEEKALRELQALCRSMGIDC